MGYHEAIYETLMENVEALGLEDFFFLLKLNDNEEFAVQSKCGDGFYAQGAGVVFIAFLPKEAFME